jgi:hypothetical protein
MFSAAFRTPSHQPGLSLPYPTRLLFSSLSLRCLVVSLQFNGKQRLCQRGENTINPAKDKNLAVQNAEA